LNIAHAVVKSVFGFFIRTIPKTNPEAWHGKLWNPWIEESSRASSALAANPVATRVSDQNFI
jgi:hypothetical protein